ncbi:hypothetical protein OHJ16_15220 [Actinomyces israelii]|uniref:Uncharacterized protein n=1 Tax=Actinomyces israelii TaxID=1659 RepID=A0ABT4ICC4_9ACTO|nr:hypothetical protein [Actinomyces israelii]MCZ0859386.1 hypothetical protein [Actinomyces israelii]
MATNDQVRALVPSHGDGDDAQFYAVAIQVAAKAARAGQSRLAQELREPRVGLLSATIAGDEGDAVLTASVYIPESQESWFLQKLDEYAATVDEDRPRHQRLIESVERIRRATARLPAAGRS